MDKRNKSEMERPVLTDETNNHESYCHDRTNHNRNGAVEGHVTGLLLH